MNIRFINNDGGGWADRLVIRDGITIGAFFRERFGDRSPADFLIRVNRQPTEHEYVLQEGDRVTVTPTKIHGALRSRLVA